MKIISIFFLTVCGCASLFAQNDLQNIFAAEKAFERAAAEKNLNQAYLEFSAPDATCFYPNPINCRDFWRQRPPSAAFMQWRPTLIDVSANGALGYATGTSVFRRKGKDDPEAGYGEYARIWQRQPDGKYLAVLDIEVAYHKIPKLETDWKSPLSSGHEKNEQKSSAAADASTAFFETATRQGLHPAYKNFLGDDARVLRAGDAAVLAKKDALERFKKDKSQIAFARQTVFMGAADLAYVNSAYTKSDKSGKQTEKGNFLQIWKLRGGRWQIVLDLFLPTGEK
jgi:hypothetical protein